MSRVKKVRDVCPGCAIVEVTDKEAFEKSVVYHGTFKSQTFKTEITLGENEAWSEIQAMDAKGRTEDSNGKS